MVYALTSSSAEDWRHLGQVIGLCEANVPCPKCGGEKTVQRQSRLRFFGAQGREQRP